MNSSRHSNEALPTHFVQTIRTLFDIMDTERSGFIRYEELARRWANQPPQTSSIPTGFLDSLRKVTPPNGMLTFERFCAGLRLALADSRTDAYSGRSNGVLLNGTAPERVQSDPNLNKFPRTELGPAKRRSPPMVNGKPAPHRRIYGSQPAVNHQANGTHSNYENFDVIQKQRKMPSKWHGSFSSVPGPRIRPVAPPPYGEATRIKTPSPKSRSQIRRPVPPPPPPGNTITGLVEGASPARIEVARCRPASLQTNTTTSGSSNGSLNDHQHPDDLRSNGVKWRDKRSLSNIPSNDSRRHTITDGTVEERANKHVRILNEEAELVERGIDVLNRLKNWYHERLSSLETRRKYAGKTMIPLDYAVHEEKLNYLRAHTTELNRRILNLMESSEHGFPSHMNLELQRFLPQPADDHITWLKRQNKSLTDEVGVKSEQMTTLEEENAELRQKMHQMSVCGGPRFVSPSSSGSSPRPHVINGYQPRDKHVDGFSNGHLDVPMLKIPNHSFEATLI